MNLAIGCTVCQENSSPVIKTQTLNVTIYRNYTVLEDTTIFRRW